MSRIHRTILVASLIAVVALIVQVAPVSPQKRGGSVDSITQRVIALEQTVAAQQQQIQQLEQGLTTAQQQISSLEQGLTTAQQQISTLEQSLAVAVVRIEDIEDTLQHVRVTQGVIAGMPGPHMIIEGCNVHVRSGSGATDDGGILTGLGNLIVGYNEDPGLNPGDREGAHNLVVGRYHRYLSFGGFVAGELNTVSGQAATVSGGRENTASRDSASVSGGRDNTASGFDASVSGGQSNLASGQYATVSGASITRPAATSPASAGG